jgi:hypothetical protein
MIDANKVRIVTGIQIQRNVDESFAVRREYGNSINMENQTCFPIDEHVATGSVPDGLHKVERSVHIEIIRKMISGKALPCGEPIFERSDPGRRTHFEKRYLPRRAFNPFQQDLFDLNVGKLRGSLIGPCIAESEDPE